MRSTQEEQVELIRDLYGQSADALDGQTGETVRALQDKIEGLSESFLLLAEQVSRLEHACTLLGDGKTWFEDQDDVVREGPELEALKSLSDISSAISLPSTTDPIVRLFVEKDGVINSGVAASGKEVSASEVRTSRFDADSAQYYLSARSTVSQIYMDEYVRKAVDTANSAVDEKRLVLAKADSMETKQTAGAGVSSLDPEEAKYIGVDAAKKLRAMADEIVGRNTPYAWGAGNVSGSSRGVTYNSEAAARFGDDFKDGFDCSGFTQYLTYATTGKDVGKHTTTQFGNTSPVDFDDVQIGDLGFNEDTSHVVMYVGNGEVAEAPSSGKTVRYSEADSSMVWRRP